MPTEEELYKIFLDWAKKRDDENDMEEVSDVETQFMSFLAGYNYARRPTKRAADSPKVGGKSAKRKVVKAKVIRPAKSG